MVPDCRSTLGDESELRFEQSKVMPVLHFSALLQENCFTPKVEFHQIYPGNLQFNGLQPWFL
jgi:hypothetical protein